MDDKLRQMMEAKLAAPRPPALDSARRFLMSYVHDSDWELLERDVGGMIKLNPNVIIDAVEAIEELLATPQPPDTLSRLVAYEANWMLDDETDTGAAAWLQDLTGRLRRWLGEHAPPQR